MYVFLICIHICNMYYMLHMLYTICYIFNIKYFMHYILLLQITSDYYLLIYPRNTPWYKEEIFLLLQCNVCCYNSIRVIRNFLILTFHSFLIYLHLHSRTYSKQVQVNLCSNVSMLEFQRFHWGLSYFCTQGC